MKHFTLSRSYCWERGTFGYLVSDDAQFRCYSVEQPWANNLPFHSCIPEGEYQVQRTNRPKHGDCFVLINESLGIFADPNPSGRDSCLIHEGNVASNVEGCIAIGNRLGVLMPDQWAVLESNIQPNGALRRLHAYIGSDQEFTLTIRTHAP